MPEAQNPYRGLPAIDRLLADERVAPLAERHGHDALVRISRDVLDEYRAEIDRAGEAPSRQTAHPPRRSPNVRGPSNPRCGA